MRRIFCLAWCICMATFLSAQPDSSFHLYLLVGQSNMAGRGEITQAERDLLYPNIYMLGKDGKWLPARHPLHFDKPAIAAVGPGIAFAKTIWDAKPNGRIGLVPCAVGGTSIDSWVPGGYDKATNTHPYDDALLRIKLAMTSGRFSGIIWHQGESDSKPAGSVEYLRKLTELVARLRKEIGNDNLPFVAGELGDYRPNYQLINTELNKMPALIPHSALASARGLSHKGDTTHFDTRSANELGKRMAEKMLGL